MTTYNTNLLIIYLDSSLSSKSINELKKSFQIKIVRKTKRVSFFSYREHGNHIISKYNRILFSTDSENVFFICASELDNAIPVLLGFGGEGDFGFFKSPSNKLTEFLSGLFVKKKVLMKIGCFDKYVFNNLYLNFLVNYLRFYHNLPENYFFEPLLKINSINLVRYNLLSLFENSFYESQILYKDYYLILKNKICPIPKAPRFVLSLIDNFVRRNTARWYW